MHRYLIALSLFFFACGEKEEDKKDNEENYTPVSGTTAPSDLPKGAGTIDVGGVNALPDITDPVHLTSAPSDEVKAFNAQSGTVDVGDFSLVAESGIDLSRDTTESKLKKIDNLSLGACEMVNRARGFLQMAGKGDDVDCMLSLVIGEADEFYDGKPHIIELVENEDGEVFREKFRFVITGDVDNVTGFSFQSCEDGKQNLYLEKTIVDGKAKVISKTLAYPDNPQVDKFAGITVVEGAIDDNGKFNGLKKIIQDYSNEFSNGETSYVREIAVQSSQNIQYEGFFTQQSGDYAIRAYSEVIDQNSESSPYDLSKFMLGDGAMIYKRDSDSAIIQGWDSSTMKVNNEASQLAKIEDSADTLPSEPSEKKTLSFEGDEKWDCSGDADYSIDVIVFEDFIKQKFALQEDHEGDHDDDEEPFAGVCGNYQLPQDDYLECHNFASDASK